MPQETQTLPDEVPATQNDMRNEGKEVSPYDEKKVEVLGLAATKGLSDEQSQNLATSLKILETGHDPITQKSVQPSQIESIARTITAGLENKFPDLAKKIKDLIQPLVEQKGAKAAIRKRIEAGKKKNEELNNAREARLKKNIEELYERIGRTPPTAKAS